MVNANLLIMEKKILNPPNPNPSKRFIKYHKKQRKYISCTNYFKLIYPTARKVMLNTAVSSLMS